jgi:glycosyltransferase involved in cell wall biosynthesis
MRIVALLETHNERRHIGPCIEHLHAQGVSVYVIDDGSTDETVEIAERYAGRGVIGLETHPRPRGRDLQASLERKQRLADSLDADWLIHVDADERRTASDPRRSLAEALHAADAAGFNAVNFLEFTFVPTVEDPNHDHAEFERTMRHYYHFLPGYPHRMNAFKRQDGPVDLVTSGGHRVAFDGLRLAPRNLAMRHYLFLSVDHLYEKYPPGDEIVIPPDKPNWFNTRLPLQPDRISLPSQRRLRRYTPGEPLDRSEPLARHPLYA